MRIIDDDLLVKFSSQGECELCGAWQSRRHAHHLWCRGMGSAFRLDHSWNLISLCFLCHRRFHDGNIPKKRLLGIVANREKTNVQHLMDTVNELRWRKKDT